LPDANRIGSIEIEQDLEFQRKSWKVQRAAWIIMILITLGGLLGVFGDGPLADARAGDSRTLTVEYQRLVRLSAEEKLAITPGSASIGSASTVSVWLDRKWMSRHDLRGMVPEPESTSVAADRVTYHFRIDPRVPSKIEFDMQTKAIGLIRGRAGIVGGSTVTFNQFSYP
jgi:hypothetical protein